jgi:uncharacterized protein (TIGR00725 family)
MPSAPRYVAVCGTSEATEEERTVAQEVGRLLAEAGAVILCGGLGGVMQAVSEGASAAGGTVIGVLPGRDRDAANRSLTFALATGLGEGRNYVLASAADGLIAIGGGWGTLSEIALARRLGRPVVGLGTWQVAGLDQAPSARQAVEAVFG